MPCQRPRGRHVPGRPRPAPRVVPFVAAAGLRHRGPRALPPAAHPRLHRGRPGPQDEQEPGQRRGAAGHQREAGRRDHPPVGGRQRLLGRHRHRRQDPGPRGGRLPPHPQHAALPAGQHQRLRSRQGRRTRRRAAGDRPLDAGARRPVPGRGAGALRGLRIPPRGGQAAAVLLRRPGRLLPRRAEGPPLHHRAQEPGAPQRADRAVAAHARHAALDGALPQLHGRRGLAGLRRQRIGLPGNLQ